MRAGFCCDLKRCVICSGCLPEWLPAIAAHREMIVLKKGETLVREGDRTIGIYFVYEGTVKVHKKWDEEKELIVRFGRPGDIVGHLGLGDSLFYPVSITASEPSSLCFFSLDFFESTLKVNPGAGLSIIRFLVNDLQETHQSMRDLAHMAVKSRIAKALLKLKMQFGTDETGALAVRLPRQDIASFAGVSYETFFKVINELTAKGFVSAVGRSISLLDEPALQAMIDRD